MPAPYRFYLSDGAVSAGRGLAAARAGLDMGRAAVALPGSRAGFHPAGPVARGGRPRGSRVKPGGPWQGRGVQGVLAQCAASASAGGSSPVRCISRLVLYQWTQAAVIFSTSPLVVSGPSRNGDPSRVHSDL